MQTILSDVGCLFGATKVNI